MRRIPILAAALVVTSVGCDERSPVEPSPPRPIVLLVTGTATLPDAGHQTQFTATAGLSNGGTRDVTLQVVWSSDDPSVATVAPGGLVTATGLGVTAIRATLDALQGTRSLIVSPVPTYSSRGWVRSPGSSAVPDVLVSEPVSRRSTVTNRAGEYSLIGLVGPRLVFEKDGYESVEITAVPNGIENDAALQPLIRIVPGGVVDDRLAPHDIEYTVDGRECGPCRRIRIMVSGAGRLRLELSWSVPTAGFRIHANGQVFAPQEMGALSVPAQFDVPAGEVLVYVGANRPTSREYFTYRLTTSFTGG